MPSWFRRPAVLLCACAVAAAPLRAQPDTPSPNRIRFGEQDLFLSGGNVAWVDFARDIGPGPTDFARFDAVFAEVRAAGGNAVRLWLHANGASTPEWSGDTVVGPGAGAIDDLRALLDLAAAHHVGLLLCLWSFDMLRIRFGETITDRNHALLTDSTRTQAYIDQALVPLAEAVQGHPGLLAWEIFNEPEGMSDEFGWSFNRRVPMAAIQRFVNRSAGAIHRADPSALVTNGSWSFLAASDVTAAPAAKHTIDLDAVGRRLSRRYRRAFTPAETRVFTDGLTRPTANVNYYSDERLIGAGGDPEGTLDFYTVHYYDWAGTALSPFHHDAAFWRLDKPLAVAEFHMNDDTFGVPWPALYPTLYDRGYAGALAWSWTDSGGDHGPNWPRALVNIETLFTLHPDDVYVVSAAPVSVDSQPVVPALRLLDVNHPNPFRSTTTLFFHLPAPGRVRLAVYGPAGRLVAVLVDAPRSAGTHRVRFDAADLAAGVYLVRLEAGAHVETRRIVRIR